MWKIFYFLGAIIAILVVYIASRHRLLDKQDHKDLEAVRKVTQYRKKHEADLFEIKERGKVSEYAISGPASSAPDTETKKEKPDWEEVAKTDGSPAPDVVVEPNPDSAKQEPPSEEKKKSEDDFWNQIIKRKDGPSFKKF